MNKTNEDEEIIKLQQIKWKTNLSRNIDKFSEVIDNKVVFEEYFGEEYIEKLASKSKDLSRMILKLGLIYTILMLSLFASQNIGKSEFEIFGYGFKNLGQYKEFLLFLAAIVSPISAIFSAYNTYLNKLIKECIKKITPDDNIQRFYSYKYIDEYIDGLMPIKSSKPSTWHGFSVFITTLFGLMLLFLLFTLLTASFLIQIFVIYDVIINPSSSYYIHLFVTAFAIVSMLSSLLVSIIQFPMPEVDNSNYLKLSKLEEENPEKYQKTMEKLAKESSKKDARSLIILYVIIYTITFPIIAIYWHPDSLNNLTYFLGKAMPGAFIIMFLSNAILGYIKKSGHIWFFRNYPDKPEAEESYKIERLYKFEKMQKIFLVIKILVPFSMSVGYSFYALSN